MRYLLIGLTIALATPSSSQADTPGYRVVLGPQVRGYKVGPGVDFSGLDLAGTEIVGHDLTGAVFDGASLRGATIFGCVLKNASFKGASLKGGRFSECDIEGADFADAEIHGILPTGGGSYPQIEYSTRQLTSTRSFKQKNLIGCAITREMLGKHLDLSGFDLTGAWLNHGDFRDVIFDGAKVRDAKLYGAYDYFDQLRKTADVRAGRFPCRYIVQKHCDLSGLSLAGADITVREGASISLEETDIDHCQLRLFGSNRSRELAATKNFKQKVLEGTYIGFTNLSGFRFDNFKLKGVIFSQCKLAGATFEGAVMEKVDLQYVNDLTVDQLAQTENYRQSTLDEIALPKGLLKELKKQKDAAQR